MSGICIELCPVGSEPGKGSTPNMIPAFRPSDISRRESCKEYGKETQHCE